MNFDELGAIIAEQTGLKICVVCGTPFKPYNSRQLTCGTEECRRERKNVQMRDKEKSEEEKERHRKWREKQRRNKRKEEEYDKIIERTQRQIEFDNYIREHGHEYGKLQMQKTLALVPKIDVNINNGEKENENE